MRKLIYLPLILFILLSCQKDDDNSANGSPVADFNYYDKIDYFSLVDCSTDPDSDPLNYSWSSNSDLINLTYNTGKSTTFNIPELNEETIVDITFTVSDGNSSSKITRSITIPVLTNIRRWGIGKNLETEKSNNVAYDWYTDQSNTGTYSAVNCGPSSVTMAIKWVDESFGYTAEDARKTYRSEGGWWYTNDIINYLNKYTISNKTIALNTVANITDEIDNGNIAILCLDMFYISNEIKNEWRINKFYPTNSEGWGHFIVVKGYKKVDGDIFFECYDPYSFGKEYEDHTLKGINRFYSADDIDKATDIWWDYAIIVLKNSLKKAEGLNVNEIPHKPGK